MVSLFNTDSVYLLHPMVMFQRSGIHSWFSYEFSFQVFKDDMSPIVYIPTGYFFLQGSLCVTNEYNNVLIEKR